MNVYDHLFSYWQVKDLLQLMIDSTIDENGGGNGPKKLTDEQIVGNSIEFLLAGYETTSVVLSYTSYLLAINTDIQQKLQAEIDDYFEEDPVSIVIYRPNYLCFNATH